MVFCRPADGQHQHVRQYSVSTARDGELPGINTLANSVKRLLLNHEGEAVNGVANNYLGDLLLGKRIEVVGPIDTSFMMPNHPKSNLVMARTGTNTAPMRAKITRRLRSSATRTV